MAALDARAKATRSKLEQSQLSFKMRIAFLHRLILLSAAVSSMGPALCAQSAQERVPMITAALRNREFDRAMEMIESAIHAYPNNAQLRAFEGLAHMGKGEQDAALRSYQAALKIFSMAGGARRRVPAPME